MTKSHPASNAKHHFSQSFEAMAQIQQRDVVRYIKGIANLNSHLIVSSGLHISAVTAATGKCTADNDEPIKAFTQHGENW